MEKFTDRSSFFLYFFERDLRKLKDEILLYHNEADIWKKQDFISNTAGNLFLHLMGNIRHFIGATLGETGYVRNRDFEFTAPSVPLEQMLREWDETMRDLKTGLAKVSDERMKENFPLEKHGEIVSVEYMLQHLFSHLNYHLGQVNYHRRLLSEKPF